MHAMYNLYKLGEKMLQLNKFFAPIDRSYIYIDLSWLFNMFDGTCLSHKMND